jgi:hypothetical protein
MRKKDRSPHNPPRSLPRRLLSVFLKMLLTVFIILVLVLFLVQTPFVQNIIRGKAEKYLSRKLNTRVQIGGMYIDFPSTVTLRNIYLGDRQKDTLLSAGLIHVNMHMWKLIHGNIDIDALALQDITVKVRRGQDSVFNFQFIADAFAPKGPQPPKKDTSSLRMALRIVRLDHVRLVFTDAVTGNDATAWIGHSEAKMDVFDPSGQHFSGKIGLASSDFDYRNSVSALYANLHLGQLRASVKAADLGRQIFALSDLRLDSGNVRFDNNQRPRQLAGMDYAHLKLNGLTLHTTDLSYSKDSISGAVTRGEFKDQSGFELDQLRVNFLYTDRQASLKDLVLRTPGTLLQRNVSLKYPSPEAIGNDPAHTLVDLDLAGSRVRLEDILLFVPSLKKQPAFAHPNDSWLVTARITGSLDALHIQTLQFSGLSDMKIDLAGTLLHPMDTKRIAANLDIRNLSGSRQGLAALLPPGTLPKNISIPERFSLKGKLDGSMDLARTDLVIHSSSGSLILKGFVQHFRDPKNARYDAEVQTKALDLGYILQDRAQWGLVTAGFAAKGKGFTRQSADATLEGRVSSAILRGYTYRDLLFSGSIADQQIQLQSSIDNEAIHFALSANADLSRKFPSVRLDWKIDTLDLLALHLLKDTLQLKGHITADFASTDPDSLRGNLKIIGVSVFNGIQQLQTDSLLLSADRIGNVEDIRFHGEMADIDWKGTYKPTETVRALQQTINQYYRLNGFKDSSFTAQQWQMKGTLRPSPIVLSYMPSLKGSDSAGFLISFNSGQKDLHLVLNEPKLVLGSRVLNKVSASVATNGQRMQYGLMIADGTGSGFQLHQTALTGYIADNHLYTSLLLKDAKARDRYRLSGQLDKLDDGLKFILNPDSLLLNYDKWLVSRENYLLYDSAGIVVNNFKISNKGESLAINSNPPQPNAPITIAFTNFSLGTLSRFADQDSLVVDGLLNGNAEVKNVLSSPVFTSDLVIKGLTYKKDTVGDLAVKVSNEKANAYSADISLEGNKNDVRVKGEYYSGEGRMDLTLALASLNLASLKPFATTQVEDMKGFLKGSLAIKGTMTSPAISGKLHFDSAMITPLVSGEPLKISNDNIEFDADGFNFSEFALRDSAGNKATIDGNVYTKDYKDYDVDIAFNATNFRLVNAPEASSRMFYGKMNIDAAVNLQGDPMDDLRAEGNLRVNKKTDFVFILPESDPEVVEREGVVRFIDKAHPGDTLVDRAAIHAKAHSAQIKGMDIHLAVETDSSAQFTMVIDERNGDALTARGRSSLVFGMDKSGKTDLTGSFEVESGAYNLSLDVLKRRFDIQRGSTITWTGDPTTAILDLSATYTANTPSIDLIENEIAGRPQTDINKFKEKLPFLVTLKMEGELLKPKITFDISLPTATLALWPDIDTKLQQIRVDASELNKQVFALLLLNRFVGADPLQSAAGGGTSVGSLAFQSASQILTNQLDQLAGSLIKGVDIHFDLNNQQDFSTGTEQDYTELNVSVSKRLFSERVQVNVGSDFDVAGAGNPNQNASNIAGDVAVDYKLTQDGRYALRAYRKNQYEAVVEGQVVETGVSFVLTFDYNKFVEIFGRSKEEKLQERRRSKPAMGPAQPTTPATGAPAKDNSTTSKTTNNP